MLFPGNWLKGSITVYNDSACTQPDSPPGDAGDGLVLAARHQAAWETCRSINSRGIHRISKLSGADIFQCFTGSGFSNLRRWHVGDLSPYDDISSAIAAC